MSKLTTKIDKVAVDAPNNQGADVSAFCGPVFDQQQEGSCTACTTRDYLLWRQNKYKWSKIVDPAVNAIYGITRQSEGDFNQDGGASLRDAFKSVVNVGVIPTSDEAYNPSTLYTNPPVQDVVFKATGQVDYVPNTASIRRILESGIPAGIAVGVCPTLMAPTPYNGMHIVDLAQVVPNEGHAILAVAYKPDPKYTFLYKIQNSWGTNYADQGFMWITDAYLQHLLFEVCTLDIPAEEPGQPTPAPIPTPPVAHKYVYTTDPVNQNDAQLLEVFCTQHKITFKRTQV